MDATVTSCGVSLVKMPFAERKTILYSRFIYIRGQAGIVKTRQVNMGIQMFFLISVNMNSGITTAIEIYIVSTTQTNSVNGSITTMLEIYNTSITEHDNHVGDFYSNWYDVTQYYNLLQVTERCKLSFFK